MKEETLKRRNQPVFHRRNAVCTVHATAPHVCISIDSESQRFRLLDRGRPYSFPYCWPAFAGYGAALDLISVEVPFSRSRSLPLFSSSPLIQLSHSVSYPSGKHLFIPPLFGVFGTTFGAFTLVRLQRPHFFRLSSAAHASPPEKPPLLSVLHLADPSLFQPRLPFSAVTLVSNWSHYPQTFLKTVFSQT